MFAISSIETRLRLNKKAAELSRSRLCRV